MRDPISRPSGPEDAWRPANAAGPCSFVRSFIVRSPRRVGKMSSRSEREAKLRHGWP